MILTESQSLYKVEDITQVMVAIFELATCPWANDIIITHVYPDSKCDMKHMYTYQEKRIVNTYEDMCIHMYL